MQKATEESKHGFQPIVADSAQLLILGTLPSEHSLQIQQYYGHPRNTFWTIMSALLNIPADTDYEGRKIALTAHGIAVWDVLRAGQRVGSLDVNIDRKTLIVNDFVGFFAAYPSIKAVCFNGAMAEKWYQQRVYPTLNNPILNFHYLRLPSTSPANATMTLAQKIQAWRVILQVMVK